MSSCGFKGHKLKPGDVSWSENMVIWRCLGCVLEIPVRSLQHTNNGEVMLRMSGRWMDFVSEVYFTCFLTLLHKSI